MFSPEILAFVDSCRVAHLATADALGRPHVVPVCFAYTDGAIWIAIDEKPKTTARLKRVRNIEENPQASLIFDRYDEDWTRLGYVLVRGSATVLTARPDCEAALAALRERYEQYRSMALEGRSLIRVTPERVTSWGDLS
jgi:PPOX class probable F420-dependent enzyme